MEFFASLNSHGLSYRALVIFNSIFSLSELMQGSGALAFQASGALWLLPMAMGVRATNPVAAGGERTPRLVCSSLIRRS
jgi:hypothetical protein